jgi:hypothetical protein
LRIHDLNAVLTHLIPAAQPPLPSSSHILQKSPAAIADEPRFDDMCIAKGHAILAIRRALLWLMMEKYGFYCMPSIFVYYRVDVISIGGCPCRLRSPTLAHYSFPPPPPTRHVLPEILQLARFVCITGDVGSKGNIAVIR